jgi:hypothetical protein
MIGEATPPQQRCAAPNSAAHRERGMGVLLKQASIRSRMRGSVAARPRGPAATPALEWSVMGHRALAPGLLGSTCPTLLHDFFSLLSTSLPFCLLLTVVGAIRVSLYGSSVIIRGTIIRRNGPSSAQFAGLFRHVT